MAGAEPADGAGQDGAWLRRLRTSAGLTQAQLAAQASVGVRTVRDLERGEARPRASSLHRLAAALGVDAEQLDRLAHGSDRVARRPPTAEAPEGGAAVRLRVDVLGPLTVQRGSGTVSISSAMQRTLLGLLAIQPGQVAGVEEIIDTLWGSTPPRTCRELVHTYVSSLRRLLAEPAGPAPLRREQSGYRLRLGPDASDAAHFADLAARARRASAAGAAQSAWQLHGEALACWRGPLLAGEGAWRTQHPAAVALAALRIAVAVEWADIGLGLGGYGRTAQVLQTLCAQEPLHEGLAARLMLALAGEGRQAAALTLFGDLRGRLDAGLGVTPGPELREAHLRVLRGRLPPATRPVGPAHPPFPSDADAAPNERSSQPSSSAPSSTQKPATNPVTNPGTNPGTPTPRSPTPTAPTTTSASTPTAASTPAPMIVPAQLPSEVSGFTGRRTELRALDALLAPTDHGAAPIAVLTGMGGVGKSALAVRWARAVRERFPDGQLYADLRGHGVGDPARPLEVLAGFLGAFGVAPEHVPADEDQASALLRSLLDRRRVLVLLDNAADAVQVRPLLPASAGCAALVTSRGRLGGLVARDGAGLLAVEPLTRTEAVELLARAIGQARAAAEREAVAEIAELCAHLPLALRITAANLATRPTHRIGDHVARLTAGARLDALAVEGDPQTAVRATFGLSCAALDPVDLRVFRLIGLAPGPDVTVGQSSALAALPGTEAGAALDRLADRNLLFERAPGRFQAHDLVRLYARELVRDTETATARADALDRLTRYYMAGVSRASQLLYPHLLTVPQPRPAPADDTTQSQSPPDASGPAEQNTLAPILDDGRAALAWLDAERPGLVALTAQLADTGAVLPALILAEGLTGYFLLRADRVHWPTTARVSLQAAVVHGRGEWLAMAWLQCGMATRAAADQDAASGHFIRSAKAARRAGWTAGEAVALNNLATSLWARGLVDEAVERFGEALALHRLSGRAAGEAVTLANLGAARLEQSREAGTDAAAGRAPLDEALNLLNQAWELHRGIGDRRNEAGTVRLLAEVYRELGDDIRALDLAHGALRLAVESGDLLHESSAHSTLATLLARTGDRERAFAEHELALDIARRVDAARETAEALMDLADTHARLNQPDDAVLAASDAQVAAVRANSVVLRRRADRVRARMAGLELSV